MLVEELIDCFLKRKTAFPLNPRLPLQTKETLLKRVGSIPPDIATLICTSGTTGTPKIAAHSYENFIASARSAAEALDLGPRDSWQLSLPLYHASGISIVYRCLVSGAKLVSSGEATHYSLVPTQLYRILQDPVLLSEYRKAKCLLIGGAPLSTALERRAREEGLPIHTSWGMTETTALAILDGRPLPHIAITLAVDGEILVRGPSLFQGYLENGALHLPLINGWFHTNDIGEWDQEGRLIWKGRKDNMFISGGENIQPEEIEEALKLIPDVLDAFVTSVEDKEFGALPAAFVLAKSLDVERWKSELSHLLPRFKIPRWFFPFTHEGEGKPNRQKLKELAGHLAMVN